MEIEVTVGGTTFHLDRDEVRALVCTMNARLETGRLPALAKEETKEENP